MLAFANCDGALFAVESHQEEAGGCFSVATCMGAIRQAGFPHNIADTKKIGHQMGRVRITNHIYRDVSSGSVTVAIFHGISERVSDSHTGVDVHTVIELIGIRTISLDCQRAILAGNNRAGIATACHVPLGVTAGANTHNRHRQISTRNIVAKHIAGAHTLSVALAKI